MTRTGICTCRSTARVFAAGKWRGIDTVAVRDSIAAINGVGHAAVACDPDFRAALAGHGYTLTSDSEIAQLAKFVGPFSKRAAQIGRLPDRYEADWRHTHPNQEPGPGLRRAWDARAWAEDRPDEVIPHSGAELRNRWLDELAGLGYRDRGQRDPTHAAATRTCRPRCRRGRGRRPARRRPLGVEPGGRAGPGRAAPCPHRRYR